MSDWLRHVRDAFNDEIGLHLHPFCSLANLADVSCKTDSGFLGKADSTGYSIGMDRYTEEAAYALLYTADSVLFSWELGKPVSFRAGAWTTTFNTLKAMERAGYKVDASGCNYSRLEELKIYPLFEWLAENWKDIGDTSQPYYPAVKDVVNHAEPFIAILEAPDNGLLADYVDSGEMIELFHINRSGETLITPRHLSIGYHADNLGFFISRLDSTLDFIDRFLIQNDSGPVVYVRIGDLIEIWNR